MYVIKMYVIIKNDYNNFYLIYFLVWQVPNKKKKNGNSIAFHILISLVLLGFFWNSKDISNTAFCVIIHLVWLSVLFQKS